MDLDTRVKLGVYHHFAETGRAPQAGELAQRLAMRPADVAASWLRLRQNRVLWLAPGTGEILMAPPFSAVPTQHRALVQDRQYFANCAWDAVGIPAALKTPGIVQSRCEQTSEPLELEIELDRAPDSDWLFHCQVPAAQWWNDLPFT